MSRRGTAYPEFVEVFEREFGPRGIWENGRLAGVYAALIRMDEIRAIPVWIACEQLRSFLLDLPGLVASQGWPEFVAGLPSTDHQFIGAGAQAQLRQWMDWLAELYALAVDLTRGSVAQADATTVAARLGNLIYDELDPFLTPRIRFWAKRQQLANDAQ